MPTMLAGSRERGLSPDELRAWDLVPGSHAYEVHVFMCELTDAMVSIAKAIDQMPRLEAALARHMLRYPWLSRALARLVT